MPGKFKVHKEFDLPKVDKSILKFWDSDNTFYKSVSERKGCPSFIFYEGPPSANGQPGIHHVMARTIKDIFCRYRTQQGFLVKRKAGWDAHGLPVELGVEKLLGITKDDIGKKISIAEYNAACRKEVMKYTDMWEKLTRQMGYWVNMDDPYVTYDSKYIETLWWLLKQLYDKGLMYKGYTIQPYSPAAGTGLSSHELNQPGCYRDVKDTTCIAQFKVERDRESSFLFDATSCDVYILAWTTTPWTLPSNTALAVGEKITYIKVRTFNPYTGLPVIVVLAKDLFRKYFPEDNDSLLLEDYKEGDKKIPFELMGEHTGNELEGVKYEQLFPWVKPMGDAFRVVIGDFVTTEDGTGIVHIAPTFGADDDTVAKKFGITPLLLIDKEKNRCPMVSRKGQFFNIEDIDSCFLEEYVNIEKYREFAGRFVKEEYSESPEGSENTLDIDLSVLLKKENKAFKVEKYVHSYPHCWRTDKPILYYPLDSWFIKTTSMQDELIKLNNSINWKPRSTGTGRFGNWLESLVDWNLSRSRYWGTPLPIWRTEDRAEEKCIGSVGELIEEIEKAVEAGIMESNPLEGFKIGDNSKENYSSVDLHRPYVDEIFLVSETGKKMVREPVLIDVWFDSGAMPFAQVHYPFENKALFEELFPADFIAEGVDQTRGWFFTLHAISGMVMKSESFKNIISNGLVLDSKGNKMSKRLGNAIDPFKTMDKYGADPLRWYMITNSQPWDNLKFDIGGVEEVRRKFFGTLYNTYNFFALYANVDSFTYSEDEVPLEERPEIDRWILSLLNSLVKEVTEAYENYEPTRAGRAISEFVNENLSNWYVRLSRKRFWGGKYNKNKISAYQTLYTALEIVAKLAAPIAPFFTEQVFSDLNRITEKDENSSVHLTHFPEVDRQTIDSLLEERMSIAQKISSMVLGLRRKEKIKVRQPLAKIMIPISDPHYKKQLDAVKDIIMAEVNIKEVEYISDTSGIVKKKIKPNFKALGPKHGKIMKGIAMAIGQMSQDDICEFESKQSFEIDIDGEKVKLLLEDVNIVSEDIPGWMVANDGMLTVALDVNITEELKQEGIAREFINRIQNLRKENDFDVTDKITLRIERHAAINEAVKKHSDYIGAQTLASSVVLINGLSEENAKLVEIERGVKTYIQVERVLN